MELKANQFSLKSFTFLYQPLPYFNTFNDSDFVNRRLWSWGSWCHRHLLKAAIALRWQWLVMLHSWRLAELWSMAKPLCCSGIVKKSKQTIITKKNDCEKIKKYDVMLQNRLCRSKTKQPKEDGGFVVKIGFLTSVWNWTNQGLFILFYILCILVVCNYKPRSVVLDFLSH